MISARSIIDALVGRVRDMEDEAGERMFQEVESYPRADLAEALKKLLAVRDRVCVLVPDGVSYESERQGNELRVSKVVTVILMASDRDIADRRAAALGGGGTVGAMAMAETMAEGLMGDDLGMRGVWVEPGDGEPLYISEEGQANGREGWSQELRVRVPGSRATRSRV